MHEVSLMQNLLDIVEKTVANEGGKKATLVHLRVGELSGVNRDALSFAFEVLSRGTVADGGKLEIEEVPLKVRCKDCGTEFNPEELSFRCEGCGSVRIEILSGREMEIDYILMDEETDEEKDKEERR